jgi:hypothetical protein
MRRYVRKLFINCDSVGLISIGSNCVVVGKPRLSTGLDKFRVPQKSLSVCSGPVHTQYRLERRNKLQPLQRDRDLDSHCVPRQLPESFKTPRTRPVY